MTTSQNYEPSSEQTVPGAGGIFEPEELPPDLEGPGTMMPEEDEKWPAGSKNRSGVAKMTPGSGSGLTQR